MRHAFPSWLRLAAAVQILSTAVAADLKVMTSGAFTAAYLNLGQEFEHSTGHKIVTVLGGSMGDSPTSIPNRLKRGESADVVILAGTALEDLIQSGKVMPGSRVDLV